MARTDTQDAFELAGRGLQHHGLRRANERAVLTVVAFNPGLSNADIARLTGLAPQTVSAILVEVERAGLIVRGTVLRGRRGQPATPIFLDAGGAYSIGIEIGWRHLDLVLIDLLGQVLHRVHQDYAFPDAGTLPGAIAQSVAGAMAALPLAGQPKLADIGIAIPSYIDLYAGTLGASPEQAVLWRNIDLPVVVAERTGLEVAVYNDGNAACWAELLMSPAPRPGDFIYLLVSRYIAAGVVGQSMLWEGPTGNSANLGSMLVTTSNGRQRSAHDMASLTALDALLAEAGLPPADPLASPQEWAALEPVLSTWIGDAGKALAGVIFNTGAVLEHKLAVIDAVVPRPVLDRLVESVTTELAQLPDLSGVKPLVTAGHLGALAPAMGAAELPLYKRYFSRSLADLAG